MRRAPWSVARSAWSGSDRRCTVHSRSRVGRDERDFTSAGSMKSSGNLECRSPLPSGSTGAAFVTKRPASSDTAIESPPRPPPIVATCSRSGSKYCARSHCSFTVKARNPSSVCGASDAKSACATT